MKYNHILIATDLLEGSEKIAKRAFELAQEFAAKLSIIHVVEPLPGYGYAFIAPAEIESQLIEEAKKQLMDVAKQYTIAEENVHVVLGPTKIEILEIAEKNGVDLVVVGTHERHGLGHLLGSTANAVIHSSKCDVLTVRLDANK